ncbi:hypothetical protein HMPREF0673_02884 [Leyella stercorea DSM 18206]|uniref:Uncharacterized protein n=1 Tax=Leyella stercorea DSM 18206 TaxID=1002367 RepID=G6B1V3_9BACT|nr:hypothetical protein HMPREF0673_02884 [Leyella stercorea DSM 18206]
MIRVDRYEHPRRSLRASASVVTSIRVGRYEHLRRSIRASASVDADGYNKGFLGQLSRA